MSARSRALIPLSAEQQAAMQAVAVTEQRRRQGRTLSAWPYASAFFRCLNGSRRISLTDLRFFAPALTKEEFHGNRLLWLAAVDKLIESFGEVCVAYFHERRSLNNFHRDRVITFEQIAE